MPYTAQRQSLNEIGAPSAGMRGVDYGSIVDAFSEGASSLIKQAYTRKLQQQQLAREDEQRQFERGRAARQDAMETAKFEHEQTMDRAKLLSEGYHEDAHQQATGRKMRMPTGRMSFDQPGAITRAMAGGAMPRAEMKDEPVMETTVPAGPHFDVERNLQYRTSTDRAKISAEAAEERARASSNASAARQTERLTASQTGREYMAKEAKDRLQMSLNARKTAGGIAKAMTGNQREQSAFKSAEGLLTQVRSQGGTVDDAIEDLNNSPEGEAYRKSGVEERHLRFAEAQRVLKGTKEGLSMQKTLGMGADESVAAIDSTSRLIAGPKSKKPTAAAPAPKAAPARTPGAKAPTVPPMDRAKQLMKEKKSRQDILRIMREEGYNVVDSSRPDSANKK